MNHPEERSRLAARLCEQCGRENPGDARFCGGCGHDMGDASQVVPHEAMADPLIGRVIADRYRIVELLGRGGMGVVYRVEHIHIGKEMAMKLLHGELARDREVLKRFRREAEASSRLSHPNTVQVFDFGSSEGLMYLVMEYVAGRDLGQIIRAEPDGLDFDRVARITAQVCGSVSEAHRAGIVHRDIKPENVMIVERPDGSEFAKVVDFGLAKLREGPGSNTVTRAGAIVGTPYYMSPEQVRGEEVDARGDVYSIGATMYKALTGTPPFRAVSPMAVLAKHLTATLERPSERAEKPVPPEADTIICRALEKDPADRYQDAEALRRALAEYLSGSGRELTDPVVAAERAASAPPSVRRPEVLATRDDVEHYETRLRRRGIAASFVGAALLAGLVVGGVFLGERFLVGEEIPTEELEPNDDTLSATPLHPDHVVEGYLGRRISASEGDADFYALVRPHRHAASDDGRERIDVIVSGVPNVDMVLEVIRAGSRLPSVEVDAAPVGQGEALVAFPIGGGDYLVRVRQRQPERGLPVENVSDPYTIAWRVSTLGPDDEREGNDSLESAGAIGVGGVLRGRIGWRDDADLYCADSDAEAGEFVLSGVEGLDLVLRVVDRATSESRKTDENGVGEGERARAEGVRAGSTCVEVSVDANEPNTRVAEPNLRYTLELTAGVDGA